MLEPTTDEEQRWHLFRANVMQAAKQSGFHGCVVAVFALAKENNILAGRLFSATASDPETPPEVIAGIHNVLAQRLVGFSPQDDDAMPMPLAEA